MRTPPSHRRRSNSRTARNYFRRELVRRVERLETRTVLSASPLDVVSTVELNTLGFQLLEEPRQVAEGVWFLGTGPAPHGLRILETNNANAADTTNADQLWTGGGLDLDLDGSGLSVGIWDEARVRNTHQEFGDRVSFGDSASTFSNHGTHVAGTVGATGVSADVRGMANQVDIVSYDWNDDYTELDAAGAAGTIVASNHSYGFSAGWSFADWSEGLEDTWWEDRDTQALEDTDFGKYTAEARDLDEVLYDNPELLSVWSAGNDRNDAWTNESRGFHLYHLPFPGRRWTRWK